MSAEERVCIREWRGCTRLADDGHSAVLLELLLREPHEVRVLVAVLHHPHVEVRNISNRVTAHATAASCKRAGLARAPRTRAGTRARGIYTRVPVESHHNRHNLTNASARCVCLSELA